MKKFVEKNKGFITTVVYINDNTVEQVTKFCDLVIRNINDNFENNETIFVIDGRGVIDENKINEILTSLNLNICAETVVMAYYQGLESSMCAGDDLAIGDFIFEFDSIIVDYDVSLVMDVYNHMQKGYDIVAASSDTRRKASRLFYWLINQNSNFKLKHETFRIISRRAINRIKILNTQVPYRKMLYATCGLPSDYIHYVSKSDKQALKVNNKNEKAYRLDSGINFMMIYTKIINRVTFFLSMIFLLVTVGTGIWAIYSYLVEDNVISGWVSLMGVMSFAFFGVFILISLLVKYMSLILELNYKKQSYVVEQVFKNLK